MCEGKGYYNLSANYDDIHSRVQCDYCMSDGIEIKDDEEKKERIDNEL